MDKEAQPGEAGGIEAGVVQVQALPGPIGHGNAVAAAVMGWAGRGQVDRCPWPVGPAWRQAIPVNNLGRSLGLKGETEEK